MKEQIILILIFYLLVFVNSNSEPTEDEQTITNLYYNKEKELYTIGESKSIDENAIAYAIYNKSYERTGWDFLAISSYAKNDSKYEDSDKAYAFGYLEGFITKERISKFYKIMLHYGFWQNNLQIPEKLKEFYKKNVEYMDKTSSEKKDSDTYWEHVYYIYRQLKGLYDGYNDYVAEDKKVDFYEFILLTGAGDFYDIMSKIYRENITNFKDMKTQEFKNFFLLHSHCSALIKLAEDYSDIWFGHNSWFTYSSMIRIFKEYHFISNKGKEKSKTIVFSSYPAVLYSLDDFYFMDSNLLVMETTNAIFDENLYDKIKPETLLTWVRAMVANRLASSAEDWTNIFKKENSGTYNNQYMILDINKINLKKKEIPEKSLMIIEQIPEEVEVNDVTQQLKNKYYWPSYNVPYSKYFYKKCGFQDIIDQNAEYAAFMDYNRCSRAKIFERDHKNIKTMEDFKHLLRYNDYENDKLSNKDPSLTIACRQDLAKEDNICNGATDVKFVSVKELLEGKINAHIISGPTNEQQPTFSWSTTTCTKNFPDKWYHEGVVDTWNFDWVVYKSKFYEFNGNKEDDDSDNESDNDSDNDSDDDSDDSDDSDNHHHHHDDHKTLIIWLCVASGIVIIIVAVIIILFIRHKLTYDKLNDKINEISFSEKDRNNKEKSEDLLLNN